MNLGIGRIIELLQHVAVGSIRQNLFGFHNGACHTARTGCKHDFGAKGEQKNAPFQTHGVGHDDDQLVALHGGDKGQADSSVAAGWLDEHRFARVESSRHFSASSIMLTPMRSFTLGQWILAFQLRHDSATQPSVTLFSRTSGVCPISSVTSFAIFMS